MEQELNKVLGERFGKTLEEACMEEIYHALLTIVKGRMKDLKKNTGSRKLYYISAEFLIGKLLSNNLINLGLFLKEARNRYCGYRRGGDRAIAGKWRPRKAGGLLPRLDCDA